MKNVFIRFFGLVAICCISLSSLAEAGLFDSIGDSLSEAGNAIVNAGGKIADEAKKVGEDVGIIEKEKKSKEKNKKEVTRHDQSASSKTATSESTSPAAALAVEAPPQGADCEQWKEAFTPYAFGEKHFNAYQTDDRSLIDGWKVNYEEAKVLLSQYESTVTPGDCPHADSIAQRLRETGERFSDVYNEFLVAAERAARDKGRFIFATAPLGDGKRSEVKDHFQAGDHIYGLIEVVKPWAEIYEGKNNCNVRVDVTIDGKKIHAQFVRLKSDAYTSATTLVFDIAPEVSQMTAYSDTNIEYGKTTATIIQGPNELTDHLGKLGQGSHTFTFTTQYYGKTWAEGSFTISGDDFSVYQEMHTAIAGGVAAGRTLPAAQMVNEGLQAEMISLLTKAGWPTVYRLNIVDKDWWLERVDGGNTPVKARYLAAVALAETPDGKYYFKRCTFHQDKLITGNFGPLYLSHQGDTVPISKENRDK